HNTNAVIKFQQALLASPDNPELARAWRERYPPGSTFKVATSAISLEDGVATPDTVFPVLRELPLPQTTQTLKNFGLEACGGTLTQSFTVSCNPTFGQLGLTLGDRLADGGHSFVLNEPAPASDVAPPVVRSLGPVPGTFQNNKPLFAQ